MACLEDPRVFLSTERTLLAWLRIELTILTAAFVLKIITKAQTVEEKQNLHVLLLGMCSVTLVLTLIAVAQAWVSVMRLEPMELPSPLARILVYVAGLLSVVLCCLISHIILFI